MHKLTCGLLAALATLAASPSALAKDRAGFDSRKASELAGVPVHVVVVNQRVQMQVPILAWSEDDKARDKTQLRAEASGYGPASKRVPQPGAGGLLTVVMGDAVTPQYVREAGVPMAARVEALRAAGCDLPAGDVFARALEDSVRATAWGRDATVLRHAAPGANGVLSRPSLQQGRWANIGSRGRADLSPLPSLELEVRYSLTPDLAALVTTTMVRAYSPTLAGTRPDWQGQPAWSDELVVVSDKLDIGAKEPAAIAEAVARETTRYAALGIPALVKKAKAGDAAARQEAWLAQEEHKVAMRAAKSTQWLWDESAPRRTAGWTADACARVRQAVDANAAETARLLGLLFAGQLDSLSPDWHQQEKTLFSAASAARNLATGAEAAERRVYSDGPRIAVSRRAGDDVMLEFRYTWLPVD